MLLVGGVDDGQNATGQINEEPSGQAEPEHLVRKGRETERDATREYHEQRIQEHYYEQRI